MFDCRTHTFILVEGGETSLIYREVNFEALIRKSVQT